MIPGQPGADLVDMEAARRHTLRGLDTLRGCDLGRLWFNQSQRHLC